LGLITDFVLVCWRKLGHYQPFVLAADNNDSGEYENKANKVVNGNHFWHGSNTIELFIYKELTTNDLIVKHFL